MNPYLLSALEHSPAIVRRVWSCIPGAQWDTAVEEGRFTPREVIAHLADWEPIMRDRIRQAVEQPGSTLQVFDEVEMAQINDYAHTDPDAQGQLWARERALTARFVSGLAAEDWSKSALHPERGVLCAEDLANLILGHDLYHIAQLTASMATDTEQHPG